MVKYFVSINANGEFWFSHPKSDIVHRVFGPSVKWSSGYECWYRDGKLHRDSGPAEIIPNLSVSYWLNGLQYEKKEYEQILRKNQ